MPIRVGKIAAPALPTAPREYTRSYADSFSSVLRLYFNRLGGIIGYLLDYTGAASLHAYTAATAAYTVTTSDFLVECTTGTFAVTLPSAVGLAGQSFQVKNSGTGTITVTPAGAETIDGDATKDLIQYDAMKVMSNGANWIII